MGLAHIISCSCAQLGQYLAIDNSNMGTHDRGRKAVAHSVHRPEEQGHVVLHVRRALPD